MVQRIDKIQITKGCKELILYPVASEDPDSRVEPWLDLCLFEIT